MGYKRYLHLFDLFGGVQTREYRQAGYYYFYAEFKSSLTFLMWFYQFITFIDRNESSLLLKRQSCSPNFEDFSQLTP